MAIETKSGISLRKFLGVLIGAVWAAAFVLGGAQCEYNGYSPVGPLQEDITGAAVDTTPADENTLKTKVKAAEGATLELDDCTVVIPPLALSEDTEITLRKVVDFDDSLLTKPVPLYSPVFSFEPHGLNFAMPVTVVIQYDAPTPPETDGDAETEADAAAGEAETGEAAETTEAAGEGDATETAVDKTDHYSAFYWSDGDDQRSFTAVSGAVLIDGKAAAQITHFSSGFIGGSASMR